MKSTNKKIFYLSMGILFMGLFGCDKDWLTENPTSSMSEAVYWKNENDVMQVLNGIYNYNWSADGMSPMRPFIFMTDEGRSVGLTGWVAGTIFQPNEAIVVGGLWTNAYRTIYRCNYFLENIDKVEKLDAAKKAQYIAEVRAIRAQHYFWLLFRYGNVPLITKVLSLEEANSQTRTPKQQLVDFVLSELTLAAADLPTVRPAQEKGRILKGCALTFKGRLLMIEKRWSEAVAAFKEIIDSDAHIIDPSLDLWSVKGNESKEIIYTKSCIADNTSYNNDYYTLRLAPLFYGGWQGLNAYQELVDDFLMIDGLSIEESPLYDPANPYNNRDPRLYSFVFLPEYTRFKGLLSKETLYLAHPSLTNLGIKNSIGATGLCGKKYCDTNQSFRYSGQDYVQIRYPEILLSYLESKLEAGDAITQVLLDQTINKVRGREAVNMPPVIETNPALLREIVRKERRVELCFEPFIRHMDLLRWGIWPACMNRTFHGMKLTNNPETYTEFPVEKDGKYKGHLISWDRTGHFISNNILLPIPQSELDINPYLGQNPGY